MAEEQYAENIQDFDPEPDFIFFLPDRVWARIMDSREFQDDDGIWRIEFIMRPDEGLIQKYNVDEDKDLTRGYITKDYAVNHIVPPMPGAQRVSYAMCDFSGVFGRNFESHMRKIIDDNEELRKKNKTLTLSQIRSDREAKKISANPMGWAKTYSSFEEERLKWIKKLSAIKGDKDED